MLSITIPAGEMFDTALQEFINVKEHTLQLEHSLVSLYLWESKWNKPFLSKDEKTLEETIDYVKCMTLTKNVDPNAYRFLTDKNIQEINEYIHKPMTATTFNRNDNGGGKGNKEIMTAEVIYYYMIALNIPFECRKWHLNQLMTLIEVCNIKQSPPKKMGASEAARNNAALNAARRKKLNTKG